MFEKAEIEIYNLQLNDIIVTSEIPGGDLDGIGMYNLGEYEAEN